MVRLAQSAAVAAAPTAASIDRDTSTLVRPRSDPTTATRRIEPSGRTRTSTSWSGECTDTSAAASQLSNSARHCSLRR
jgi:hypothetical protein